jgi:hypothetical protein
LTPDLLFRCTKSLVTEHICPQTRHIWPSLDISDLRLDISDLRPDISGPIVLTV